MIGEAIDMKEKTIKVSIPRPGNEKSIIRENIQLIDTFFNKCRNSPEKVIESDIQTFFDVYNKLEEMQEDLLLSQWAHYREYGESLKDTLNTIKKDFDGLEISIKCKFDFDRTEILHTFGQIRTIFSKTHTYEKDFLEDES